MLEGKTAFVSGGTGAVGSAIVRCLAGHGARIAFSFHSQADKARQLEQELAGLGWPVKAFPLNVLDGQAAMRLVETIERDWGNT